MSASVLSTPSALALASENAAANRRSSASSASSDLNDHGMPVLPYLSDTPAEALGLTIKPPAYELSSSMSVSESDHSSVSETSTLEPSTVGLGHALQLQSPKSAGAGSFTFEEIMSPRHQKGKRYLGGYLFHRVSMAGGFLKSWKRKYFRLRDHGILCFKDQDDTSPMFEIHFRPQSVLLVDKPGVGTAAGPNGGGGVDEATMLSTTKGKVNASLLLILKHIEVQGHQTPANKVDVPVYLKAENEIEFYAWLENVRLKIEARKRASTQEAVNAALSGVDDGLTNEASGANESTGPFPPRPKTGATGDSVSFTERHGSLQGPSVPAEPTSLSQERRASVHTLAPLGDTKTDSAVKNKLLFVAGSTPDPAEFATFRSKYLLMKEIGEGSFSIVHRAVNRLTGQLCAVKCCKRSNALDEEVAIMRRVSHPNLVALEGVYVQDEMYYVVMDYMEEGDLCERLIQRQRFTENEARVVITQVLRGLEHLHRNNILHRDIKPENILLHGGIVKIADFGLARQLPTATSMLKRSCGTLEYAAPELLRGQAYGLKSDIFSLGVVLYVLLFGAFPFTIESAAALQRMERFPDGVDVRDMSCLNRDNAQWKQVSSLAQDALLRMLSVNDKERASAKELLTHPWFDSARTVSSRAGNDDRSTFRQDSDLDTSFTSFEECELERVRDCRAKGFTELLSRGLDVTKFGKAGNTSPHLTTLVVDFVHGTISWTARGGVLGIGGSVSSRKVTDTTNASMSSKRSARVISFNDVEDIRIGHTTEAFRSITQTGRDAPVAGLCVSVVASWRTLDFAVKATSQREFVVIGLKNALDLYRSKHPKK